MRSALESLASTSPRSRIRLLMWVVFPPGEAAMSSTSGASSSSKSNSSTGSMEAASWM